MAEIRIFSARLDNIPAIIEIARSCGLEEWSPADYADELGRSDSIVLVAEAANADAVGFIAGRRVPGGAHRAVDAEIYNIGVRPEDRKRGIGRMLIDAFLTNCRKHGVRNIWLEVRASNETAIRFYAAQGFVQAAVRKHFYKTPVEDALILRRTA